MHRRGFSLVEIAVVLVLAALMTGYILKMKPAANAENCNVTTSVQLRDIQGAVARFVMKNDRLPMPAARTQGVDDINYGREALAAALDVTSGITMGALPFQALSLPATYAADCWGNKFSYAVTTLLTTTVGYSNATNLGAITIKSSAANTLLTTASYAVVSHGADGVGAVARNYTSVSRNWCTLSSVLQTENCDISNAIFMATEISDGAASGNNRFDDIVVFRGKDAWGPAPSCVASSCSGACGGGAGLDNCGNACTNSAVCPCVASSCSGACGGGAGLDNCGNACTNSAVCPCVASSCSGACGGGAGLDNCGNACTNSAVCDDPECHCLYGSGYVAIMPTSMCLVLGGSC
jgi:prepilin-type N-terminal cleavage/methylation domain-containing protein